MDFFVILVSIKSFFSKFVLFQEISAPNYFETIIYFVLIIVVANFSLSNPSGISGTLVSLLVQAHFTLGQAVLSTCKSTENNK